MLDTLLISTYFFCLSDSHLPVENSNGHCPGNVITYNYQEMNIKSESGIISIVILDESGRLAYSVTPGTSHYFRLDYTELLRHRDKIMIFIRNADDCIERILISAE